MPNLTHVRPADAAIEDQISALEDFLRSLDPQPPVTPATPPVTRGRRADLHRAKLLIDEAIDLMAPHFPASPRR